MSEQTQKWEWPAANLYGQPETDISGRRYRVIEEGSIPACRHETHNICYSGSHIICCAGFGEDVCGAIMAVVKSDE